MWALYQSTGEFTHDDVHVAWAYSGHGEGKNNPAMQSVPNVGPLPRGRWTFGPLENDHPHLGPDVMPLTPVMGTVTFGRSGFFCHGDSISHPGDASDGCLILAHNVRLAVADSPDKDLLVTDVQPIVLDPRVVND